MGGWPRARAIVSCLLAASGLASLAAARELWWPACRWGEFNAPDCLQAQDDAYRYTSTEPWAEISDAAILQTVALLLLALVIAFLPVLWLRRPVAVIALSTGALTLSFVVVAVATYVSGLSGQSLGSVFGDVVWVCAQVALVVALLGWPVYLLAALAATLAGPFTGVWGRVTAWRLVFLTLLLASTPLAQVVLTPMVTGYLSHGATPWSEGVSGALLLCAALVVWPATASLPWLPAQPVTANVEPGVRVG
jgi:hypothetical protein